MARRPFDTFLPSGAVDQARFSPFGSRSNSVLSSPSSHAPRSVPAGLPPLHATNSTSSNTYASSPAQRSVPGPLSPPKTRSSSADENAAALIEDWRAYTAKLRDQAQNERAHIAADRARMEEVMADERALWDTERADLKARLRELEENNKRLLDELALKNAIIAASGAMNEQNPPMNLSPHPIPSHSPLGPAMHSPSLTALQVTSPPELPSRDSSTSHRSVPQESGRNPDGSPFWEPAHQTPSRTFENEDNSVRVSDISVPRDIPIRVAPHELTATDFGLSTPQNAPSRDSSHETCETVDISQIHPGLEGVSIKATALSPEFAAKILSPKITSPTENISPGTTSPMNIAVATGNGEQATSEPTQSSLGVTGIDEHVRRTLHAGHTPNHSISVMRIPLEELKAETVESNDATPTQAMSPRQVFVTNDFEQLDGGLDEDPPLKGPLGLTNNPSKDDLFLSALTNRLEEVVKSAPQSPSEFSLDDEQAVGFFENLSDPSGAGPMIENEASHDNDTTEQSEDMVPLRLKPSTNFGKPLGQL